MARILLAESDRKIREFIAGILADCGHDVHACENGTEASAWLLERPVDVLVSDLVLSGTSRFDPGYKLCRPWDPDDHPHRAGISR